MQNTTYCPKQKNIRVTPTLISKTCLAVVVTWLGERQTRKTDRHGRQTDAGDRQTRETDRHGRQTARDRHGRQRQSRGEMPSVVAHQDRSRVVTTPGSNGHARGETPTERASGRERGSRSNRGAAGGTAQGKGMAWTALDVRTIESRCGRRHGARSRSGSAHGTPVSDSQNKSSRGRWRD